MESHELSPKALTHYIISYNHHHILIDNLANKRRDILVQRHNFCYTYTLTLTDLRLKYHRRKRVIIKNTRFVHICTSSDCIRLYFC